MVVLCAQFLFVCTTVYRCDEGLNTWQEQDYVSKWTAEHLIDHVELQTCKHGRYDQRKKSFIGDTNQRREKNAGEKL
jgi:hypothetical protein